MADMLVQVTIPYFTALPADVAVNTWSFGGGPADEDSAAEIGSFLNVFYTALQPYLSPALDTENVRIKMYDRSDAEPRVPFVDAPYDLGSPGSTIGLPEEVAACLSFAANLESGQPQARRRGRVYLGPLNTDVLSYTNRTLLDAAFITDVLDAYELAWDELTSGVPGLTHQVWSGADETGRVVTKAWMDNSFDTQRRRGPLASSRTTRNGPF